MSDEEPTLTFVQAIIILAIAVFGFLAYGYAAISYYF